MVLKILADFTFKDCFKIIIFRALLKIAFETTVVGSAFFCFGILLVFLLLSLLILCSYLCFCCAAFAIVTHFLLLFLSLSF